MMETYEANKSFEQQVAEDEKKMIAEAEAKAKAQKEAEEQEATWGEYRNKMAEAKAKKERLERNKHDAIARRGQKPRPGQPAHAHSPPADHIARQPAHARSPPAGHIAPVHHARGVRQEGAERHRQEGADRGRLGPAQAGAHRVQVVRRHEREVHARGGRGELLRRVRGAARSVSDDSGRARARLVVTEASLI